jgi:hypothetical protein
MSNNIPILVIGGGALAAGVYFLTKSKDPVAQAKARRDTAIARGGPKMEALNMEDPPLKGAQVAEGFNIERRGDWSKDNPKFVLSGDGAVFTSFNHRRQFKAPANHPLWGNEVCRGGCVLYTTGSNPNAKYPSEFVETSKGIAAILGTAGTAATGIFKAKSQFDLDSMRLKGGGGGGGGGGDQAALLAAIAGRKPKSNTGVIAAVAIGGIAMMGMMFFMMNQGKDEDGK